MAQYKQYVIEDENQSDTRIKIRLCSVPIVRPNQPEAKQESKYTPHVPQPKSYKQHSRRDLASYRSEDIDYSLESGYINSQDEMGEPSMNYASSLTPNYEASYRQGYPANNSESADQTRKKRNEFWMFRHNKEKHQASYNREPTYAMTGYALMEYALSAARRTNERVLANRYYIRQLVMFHEKSKIDNMHTLNSSNSHFKVNEYPVLLTDSSGRTFYNQNNNGFVAHSGTVQTFIQRNLSTEYPSYLEEVAKYGNFAHHQTRKRRRYNLY